MEDPRTQNDRRVLKGRRGVLLLILSVGMILVLGWILLKPGLTESPDGPEPSASNEADDWNRVENGIHVKTGLKDDEGLMTVVTHCTACHSAQLVIQNRMNKERWNATIRWMQETQNLWDLGDNQEVIVNYLVRNYPPTEKGRRENLKNIEWYELEDWELP